jgi:hypothetical protein
MKTFIKEIRYYLVIVVTMVLILPDRKNHVTYLYDTGTTTKGSTRKSPSTFWIRTIDERLDEWNRRGYTEDELSREIFRFLEKEFLGSEESKKQIEEYINNNFAYYSDFTYAD